MDQKSNQQDKSDKNQAGVQAPDRNRDREGNKTEEKNPNRQGSQPMGDPRNDQGNRSAGSASNPGNREERPGQKSRDQIGQTNQNNPDRSGYEQGEVIGDNEKTGA